MVLFNNAGHNMKFILCRECQFIILCLTTQTTFYICICQLEMHEFALYFIIFVLFIYACLSLVILLLCILILIL